MVKSKIQNLKNEIIFTILARQGSKGVKFKNIKKICGKPLIYFTIKEAKKSKYYKNIYVSTDSKLISKISKKFGAKVPFLRPKKLSSDKANGRDALEHLVKYVEVNEKKKFKYVINLPCTNPFRSYKDIDIAIKILVKKKPHLVTGVQKVISYHPARIKKITNGYLKDFMLKEKPGLNRQQLKPDVFIRNGSIYAFNRSYISKNSKIKKTIPLFLKNENSINIDSEIDFKIAEYLLKKNV